MPQMTSRAGDLRRIGGRVTKQNLGDILINNNNNNNN
eukprot:CAMPEP_0194761710 /NCGR_PEP_ID=MMETSP0323_2-20130528/14376_1 /TAXON_ID=2866 ORGANISM="Crypthecodinium cohnii, Strain Seligo" /NCGR_SAMPLE_ID=MMETSP0323_2 /ASSEMBLY_ACC=CAM_ASM_000346 /LENGTH=36 /DNA_ID= /DNA_START= /DNA_END= /DNA_ORIENTATION=